MKSIFDFDNGNGVYDVVTRKDYERWQEEAQKEADKRNSKNENARETGSKKQSGTSVPF
jgi:heme/copper-type cytochrome/quinol oxidase subunit 2